MNDRTLNIPDYLDTAAAAELIDVKETTLHVWHSNGGGPHRITGVRKNALNHLEWPKGEVLRVMADRGRLTLTPSEPRDA